MAKYMRFCSNQRTYLQQVSFERGDQRAFWMFWVLKNGNADETSVVFFLIKISGISQLFILFLHRMSSSGERMLMLIDCHFGRIGRAATWNACLVCIAYRSGIQCYIHIAYTLIPYDIDNLYYSCPCTTNMSCLFGV